MTFGGRWHPYSGRFPRASARARARARASARARARARARAHARASASARAKKHVEEVNCPTDQRPLSLSAGPRRAAPMCRSVGQSCSCCIRGWLRSRRGTRHPRVNRYPGYSSGPWSGLDC
ncbi:MAG: hypothetical protein CME01_05875 [Geminicoccus sp.]|nr:hypothetical protein [Geminicoccus sp.]